MLESKTVSHRKTLGLALSGSGNRTTFYVGFLEVLVEEGINIDFISACSGGTLVASAYACGTLHELKEILLTMQRKDFIEMATGKRGVGGLYSLDLLQDLLYNKITKGKKFEEVRPYMTFTAVDIQNGEPVDLCMGDIARAARISCTVPGIFEPVQRGNSTLVDGGILMLLPVRPLLKYEADVIVGISTGGTKHVFAPGLLSLKKGLDFFMKSLYIDQIKLLFENFYEDNGETDQNNPGLFTTLGKSMDLAIQANSKLETDSSFCNLIIEMKIPKANKLNVNPGSLKEHYELGRESAKKHISKIKELIT